MMKLFECYKYYQGAGNPYSDLWIFGFEPGGNPFGKKENEYGLLNNALESDNSGFVKYLNSDLEDEIEGNTYRYVSMILEYFRRDECINKFQNKFSIYKSSNAFYSNLFPLSYPSEFHDANASLFKEYQKYFSDLSEQGRADNYPIEMIKTRFENNFTDKLSSPKKIVVLKLNYIDYYSQLFGLELKDSDKIYVEKVKWGCGNSEWPIYKTNDHFIAFLPNGRIGRTRLEKFLKEIDKS
jgi:hypothetical protein